MTGVKDLFASERGVFCIALLLTATVLVMLGRITGADWLTFMKWLSITLVASKTITGTVETATGTAQQPPPTA